MARLATGASLEKAWTKRFFVHLVEMNRTGWRHVVKISGILHHY